MTVQLLEEYVQHAVHDNLFEFPQWMVPLDLLRRIIPRNSLDEALGWRKETAKYVRHIVGRTKDNYIIYTDGIGLAGEAFKDFQERMQKLITPDTPHELLVEFLRYGGYFPPRHDSC